MQTAEKPRLEERLAPTTQRIRTPALAIDGQLRVDILGVQYEGVTRVEISYSKQMDVEIKGAQKTDGKEVKITAGEVSATGYRSDPGLTQLYREPEELRIRRDPHVVLFQKGNRITLNQVQGVPKVYVEEGKLKYT